MEKSSQRMTKALDNTPSRCLALLLMNVVLSMFEIACAHFVYLHGFCPVSYQKRET